MPDEKTPSPPVVATEGNALPLDRAALERVLARAAELQVHTTEAPEGLTDAQLLEVGKEVGLSPEHIRQALAEERTRVTVPEEHGVVGSWFGPTVATASRLVNGTAAQVLSHLDGWMQREELLRTKRRFTDRLTWEPRRDFLGSIQAGFNFSGRAFGLTPASEVGATVVQVEKDRVLVRLDADFAPARRRSVGWAAGVAALGVTSGAGLVAAAGLMAEPGLLVVGGVAGSVWTLASGLVAAAVARVQRRKVARGQLALEQVLDRLEHGQMKNRNPIIDFLSAVR
jgi:hypothetical protein